MTDKAIEAAAWHASVARAKRGTAHLQQPVAPEILRYSQTAQFLGIGETRLWQLQREADFPKPVALGARGRGWLRGDLIAWLQSRKVA